MAGTRWARFRARPWWAQGLVWILLSPMPLLYFAASRRRALWWALSALAASAWLVALVRVPGLAGAAIEHVAQADATVGWGLWLGAPLLLSLLLLYAIVFEFPVRLVSADGLTKEQVLKARNEVRSSLFAALGGAVALAGGFIGGYVGLRQLQVNQEGQVTERFTRAIDQLGSAQLDVRVGGIYALERLARDSKGDHPPIMEILTTFLRQHASRPAGPQEGQTSVDESAETYAQSRFIRPPADVQAALTVLGRRSRQHDPPNTGLDLTALRIRRADLRGDFARASFIEADLQRANLTLADLRGARLDAADLEDAELSCAILEGAYLVAANLHQANLIHANLRKAHLGPDLQGVTLNLADLQGASLIAADLQGASLAGANLGDADLTQASLTGADLKEASLLGADLTAADLKGARANAGTKWPAGFDPAAAGVVMEQERLTGTDAGPCPTAQASWWLPPE